MGVVMPAVVPADAVPLQTQPSEPLVIGGEAQCVLVVNGVSLGAGPDDKNSALTKTGMTAPVFRLKD